MGILRGVTYPTNYVFIDWAIKFVVDGTEYAVHEDGSIVKVQESL